MTALSQPETPQTSGRAASVPNPQARTLLMSVNPRAGSGARHKIVEAIRDLLARGGYLIHECADLTSLHKLAVDFQEAGQLRAVLAVGGDGTASVVRNHVPLEIPLLPVQIGTENLLGKYLGQPATPHCIQRTVEEGVVISLDLGRAGNRYFLLMISAGFDAEVVRTLHENRHGNIRKTSYFMPIFKAIRGYSFPPMRLYLETSGARAQDCGPEHCRWLFGFNLPVYALGLPISSEAVATDGQLDVCTFERGAVWSIGRYLWHVLRRLHHTLPDARLYRSERFRIEPTTDASVAYQIDGDFGGTLPIEVEVLPAQLRLLVPRKTALRLGFTLP